MLTRIPGSLPKFPGLVQSDVCGSKAAHMQIIADVIIQL